MANAIDEEIKKLRNVTSGMNGNISELNSISEVKDDNIKGLIDNTCIDNSKEVIDCNKSINMNKKLISEIPTNTKKVSTLKIRRIMKKASSLKE